MTAGVHENCFSSNLTNSMIKNSTTSVSEKKQLTNNSWSLILKSEYVELSCDTTVQIIFSRACLYYERSYREQPDQPDQLVPCITTDEIGSILKNEYSIGNVSIDYFYLFIQVEEDRISKNVPEVNEKAYSILNGLPGARVESSRWRELARSVLWILPQDITAHDWKRKGDEFEQKSQTAPH